jgi:hypothetical protein
MTGSSTEADYAEASQRFSEATAVRDAVGQPNAAGGAPEAIQRLDRAGMQAWLLADRAVRDAQTQLDRTSAALGAA